MKYFKLIIIFLIVSCTSDNLVDKPALGGKKYGGTFTYYSTERTTVFFPLASVTLNDQRVLTQIFEPLFKINNEGKITKNLAKKYEELAGGKIIQITIKSNVHFQEDDCFSSNENILTASDVKFSLDFACSGNQKNSLGPILKDKIVGADDFYLKSRKGNLNNGVHGIKIINDTIIQIFLKRKFSGIQKILAHPSITIFSKKAYDFYKDDIVNHPIGTGPFQFLSTDKLKTVLVRNPNYWKKDKFGNQLPFLKEINILYTNKLNEEYQAFSKKKSDIIFELPLNELNNTFGSLDDAKKGKNLLHRVVLKKGAKVNYISFDCSSFPFNKVKVRKAFSLAIDRKHICLDVLNGEGNFLINGFIPKSSYYLPSNKNCLKFNPEEAKRLLSEAGFNNNNPFPKLTFYVNAKKGSSTDKWVRSLIKQYKDILNIDLQIKNCSLNEKYKAIKNKKAKIWKSAWVPDYPDPDAYLSQFFGNVKQIPNEISYYNSFHNKFFDSLYLQSQLAKNLKLKDEYQKKCDEILIDEAAIAPVFSEDLFLIVNLRVRDFNINSSGIIDFSKIYIKEVN